MQPLPSLVQGMGSKQPKLTLPNLVKSHGASLWLSAAGNEGKGAQLMQSMKGRGQGEEGLEWIQGANRLSSRDG